MKAKTSITALMLLMALGTASCAAGRPGRTGDKGTMDHGMDRPPVAAQYDQAASPGAGHAGHEMGPAVMDGSWSYLGRDNPKPFKDKRWEMIPVPGYDFLYLNTQEFSSDLVCEALRDNPRIMVDRATRKTCGMPETPSEHGKPMGKEEGERMHPGMVPMRHDEHADMTEHWMAPEEAAKRPNPVPADRSSIERGRSLYQTHCTVCHGPQGRGDGPAAAGLSPRPPDLAEMAALHPPGDLAWKIENGRGPMPGWKGILKEREIWDIVNFIKNLKKAEMKPGAEQHDHQGEREHTH